MRVFWREKGRDGLYKIWNTTEEYMIIYFESDGGSLVFSDAIYPIEKGGICFVGINTPHYTVPDDPQNYVRSKIFVSEKAMRALLSSLCKESEFYRLFTENDAVYAKILQKERQRVDDLFSRAAERSSEVGSVAAFFYLMTVIADRAVRHTQTPDSFMARAIQYVNSAYGEEISLEELCKSVNMSKSHFCRKFKATMGMTAMEYIFTTRIAEAKRLLASESLSISQISERCGFSSVSYFCQKFKEETGMTAKEFRARNTRRIKRAFPAF